MLRNLLTLLRLTETKSELIDFAKGKNSLIKTTPKWRKTSK